MPQLFALESPKCWPIPLPTKEQHILDNHMEEFLQGIVVGNCVNCLNLGTADSICKHCKDESLGVFHHLNWAVLICDQEQGQCQKHQNPYPLDTVHIKQSPNAFSEAFLKQHDPQMNVHPPNGPQPMHKFSASLTCVVA